MRRGCLGAVFVVMICVASAAAPPATASPSRVLLRTPTQITRLALDVSGRAAWIQMGPGEAPGCYLIHVGALMRGQDVVASRWYAPPGPEIIEAMAGPVVTTLAGPHQRTVWAETFVSADEQGATLWSSGSGLARNHLATLDVFCGIEGCASGAHGTTLGPVAARDGVVLYSVSDISASSPCSPQGCDPVMTGGLIRRVAFDAAGHPSLGTVSGAPPAVVLTTAGGLLAEQPYDAQGHPAAEIQIRDVSTGALVTSLPVSAGIDSVAMSRSELAVLTTDAQHGHHLPRYDAATGRFLGSTPLAATVDQHSLAIYGSRIVYQTTTAIRAFRIDLGHAVTVTAQRGYSANLGIDCYGVRWTTVAVWPKLGGAIHGIDLPRT